jgi:hypothetical protein
MVVIAGLTYLPLGNGRFENALNTMTGNLGTMAVPTH